MIDNWEDKLWEIAERYNTSKPVSGDWSTETEHELNAISEELGISKYSAKYLMISRLGFSEDMFDDSDNKSSFTTEEAVQEAFPNISEHTVDIISRWYNREGSSEDFSDKEEFAEYIKGDFMNMFWGGDYNDNDFHEVANDMINAGYYDSSDFPYDNEIESSRQIKSARYIATDPENGEVLGSADTYEEAVNEWGEDVTITDSEATENQEDGGLFSSNKTIKSSVDDDDDTIDVEVLAKELVKEGYEPDIVEQIKDKWINEYSISELT